MPDTNHGHSGMHGQTLRAKASLELPHECDQAIDMTGGQSSAVVEQAGRDIRRGLKGTSKGPEMDRTYKKLRS